MKTNLTIAFLILTVILPAFERTGSAQTQGSGQAAASSALSLNEAQRQAIKRIRLSGETKGALPALRLARVVKEIYENMLADKPNEALRARLSAEMKEATWKLLTIKGQMIRETVNLLTPQQKQLIKSEMRKPGAPADLGELIERTFKLEK